MRILFTPYLVSTSMFSNAKPWKRYSLPSLRAGSPQHLSSLSSVTIETSALRASSTTAAETFWLRASRVPAQPGQYRISATDSSATVGTPRVRVIGRSNRGSDGPMSTWSIRRCRAQAKTVSAQTAITTKMAPVAVVTGPPGIPYASLRAPAMKSPRHWISSLRAGMISLQSATTP